MQFLEISSMLDILVLLLIKYVGNILQTFLESKDNNDNVFRDTSLIGQAIHEEWGLSKIKIKAKLIIFFPFDK